MAVNWSQAQIEEIVSTYRSGHSIRAIASRFGVSETPVTRVLEQCSEPVRPSGGRAQGRSPTAPRACKTCGEVKVPEQFYRLSEGRSNHCKACCNRKHAEWTKANLPRLREYNSARRRANLKSAMCHQAKARAVKCGLPYDLTPDDFEIPEVCPVLGIPLKQGDRKKHDASPSLDRIVPALGYVRGNVAVISQRANVIKNNGTAEEHEKIAAWMRSQTNAG